MEARRAAEWVARHSYGKLIAYLAAQTRDVTAAQDALGEAFLTALKTWPEHGVPKSPEAWLLVTARHRLIDAKRRSKVQEKVLTILNWSQWQSPFEPCLECDNFPDDRLKLLFICAHPAIDGSLHTPLMLQIVLGLNAAQIASAFLVAPSTMSQRLVRAKAKIRDAGMAFELPEEAELPSRLAAVLAAIYAAFTHAWEVWPGSDSRHQGLTEEAIGLARLCVELMPDEPETYGLLALILYCEARRPARRTSDGEYIPLMQQDTKLWSLPMIQEAERLLAKAATFQVLGRFQLEAAIQSIHSQRRVTPSIDWEALVGLYDGLLKVSPSIGARVGQAAAISELLGWQQGLLQLDSLPSDPIQTYQPYWALKAHLLKQLERQLEAQQAYSRAIGLTEDPAVRKFLVQQLAKIDQVWALGSQ